MEAWMTALIGRLQGAFGARLLFVGLQGSRARGEAGQGSDIDAVVILDAVPMEDIRTYRDVLAAMPGREDACGFFGGREELMRWERGDLFQFVHDTIPFYGALPAITPPLDREDARRAALSGACNIYHGCMHNLLFGRDVSILQGLYKMAAFALRARHFWEVGEYIFRTDDLRARLAPPQALLLDGRAEAQALQDDGAAFEALAQRLLAWAGGTIRALGGDNANDT